MNKHYILLFTLLFSVSLLAQKQEYLLTNIDSILKVDANSVVRKNFKEVTIFDSNSMNIKSEFALTVFNDWGRKNISLSQYYSPEMKIKDLRITIYDKNGNKIETIKESKFDDVATSKGYTTIAQDGRYKFYNYQNANYPYTIVLNKEYESTNTCFIPKFYFQGRYSQSVESAEFIFNNPNSIPYKYKNYNFNKLNIKQLDSSKTRLHYKAIKLTSNKQEKQCPKFSSFSPYVSIALEEFTLVDVKGKAKDWKTMGAWQNEVLLKNRRELPKETIDEVTSLVADAKTTKEKAKLIYEYVQNKTRYVSIQLGIGGWKPILASEVDRLGYGDCKALTNYTKALLNSQNIVANYTVIYAGNNIKNYNEDMVCMQGNHVILNLPNDGEEDTWLECTSQSSPFGYISGFTDNRKALVITPEGGIIKKTKKYTTEENKIICKISATLDTNNALSGKWSRSSEGATYSWYKGIKNAEKKENHYKKIFPHLNNLSISNSTFKDDKESISFNEKFDYSIESYGSLAGDKLLTKAVIFNQYSYKKLNEKKRKLPIERQRGYLFEDTYTIKLANGLKIYSIPENKKIDSKYGNYKLSFTKVSDSEILVARFFKISEGLFPPEEIKDYNNFFKKVSKYDNTKFISSVTN